MSVNHESSMATAEKVISIFSVDPNIDMLRKLTNHTPTIIIATDSLGIITMLEGNALRNGKTDIKSLVGQSIFEQYEPVFQFAPYVLQAINGVKAHGRVQVGNKLYSTWIMPNIVDGESQGTIGIAVDQTNWYETEAALNEIQRHYLLLAEHTNDLITKHTPNGICIYASPAAKKILGYRPDELIGKSVYDLLHPDDIKSKRRSFTKLLEAPGEETICYRIRCKDERYIWLETTSKPGSSTEAGVLTEIIVISRDITERKESEERLLHLANFDSLTGLPNRALFRDRLRRAIIRAQRNASKIALLFLDLDRFKNINDSLGHHAGDQLLRGVARRLKQTGREGDTIARLGGDEFTVILEGIKESEDAATVCQKILDIMRAPFKLDGHDVVVTPSIGITIFPDDAMDMRALLKNADTAMYRSKELGRNSYQFYTADMNAKAYESLLLETRLRHAIDREEFILMFQPQIDLHSQAIIGIEALLRWQNPDNAIMQPEQFIPFAEETGLIIPIGAWVLQRACMEAKKWQNAGYPIRVAVNLSMYQFIEMDFVNHVKEALRQTRLDPRFLELEVTESVLAHNVEQAVATLQELHELGVHLSIDDFGTGYSSLNYLKRFPLNTLKIDQSFVQDITTDNDSAAICEAIIALGKSLRLNVIAEGVETQEQAFFLRNHGCDLVQGFYISHPMASEKVLSWLKQNRKRQFLFEQWEFWPDCAHNG